MATKSTSSAKVQIAENERQDRLYDASGVTTVVTTSGGGLEVTTGNLIIQANGNIDTNGLIQTPMLVTTTTLLTPSLTGAPESPNAGQVYWDSDVEMLYCYTNATSGWVPLL